MEQHQLTEGVRNYYNKRKEDSNWLLSRQDDIVNHHYGIGDFPVEVLHSTDQSLIKETLHYLELNQIEFLICLMSEIKAKNLILDAGCGRGGTSFTLHKKFDVITHGVNVSDYQVNYCKKLATAKGLEGKANFKVENYLNLSFPDQTFDHIITNETTQYSYQLQELFNGFRRVLKIGGRYTIATWCLTGDYLDQPWARHINQHYGTTMHPIANYLQALEDNGFSRIIKCDATELAIPYFELRRNWEEKSGVEAPFLEGFRSGQLAYYFLSATRRQ